MSDNWLTIAHFKQLHACAAFIDYLNHTGYKARHQRDDATHEIAVQVQATDQDLHDIKALLTHFLENPDHPKYQAAAWSNTAFDEKTADAIDAATLEEAYIFKTLKSRTGIDLTARPPLVIITLITCVVIAFWSNFGILSEHIEPLLFVQQEHALANLPTHEWYRVLTPSILHFSWMHLIFNAFFCWYFATPIEKQSGSVKLAVLMLFFAAFSNIAQHYFSTAAFGGLSGVVFGLFGYVWLADRLNTVSYVNLPPRFMTAMGIFLLLGFTGLIGPIANYAHLGGLIAGLIAAWTERLFSKKPS